MNNYSFPVWKVQNFHIGKQNAGLSFSDMENEAMSTILKKWRSETQTPAEHIASKIGVTLAMWSRWETGRRRIPAERVPSISEATGIPPDRLRPDVFKQPESAERAGSAA